MGVEVNLEGKVALVTGASTGLGESFAKVLAKAGASVILASRKQDKLKELRAEIEADGGEAHTVFLDVTNHDSIRAAVAHAETEVGAIDILVNNTGVSRQARLIDTTEEDFDFVFDTNVRGSFFMAQEVAKRMISHQKAHPHKQARIINIASVAAMRVLSQIGVYCMSKTAIIQMTKAMALEWGKYNINVNVICPGYIDTEMNHDRWTTEAGQKFIQGMPRHRIGKPEDLNGLMLLLASDASHFINGSVLTIDDGLSLGH